jgi:hypothetical protein
MLIKYSELETHDRAAVVQRIAKSRTMIPHWNSHHFNWVRGMQQIWNYICAHWSE